MKKIHLILVVVAVLALLLLGGCQFKAVEEKVVQTSAPETGTVESSTPSAEEAEVSQGLEDMDDLDKLEKEINELEVEDLENTTQ